MAAQLVSKPGEDVAARVPELGSPDAATRDNAAVKIRESGGVAAIPLLTEAADSPDAELRKRARALLRDIGGDHIKLGVRRLMAIRTLGELGKPQALPTLKPLLDSKELFEPDYARTAIDLIEGRADTNRARAVASGVADDVWLLPRECRAVGQLVPRRGSPLGYAEFMAAVRGTDEERKKLDAETTTKWLLSLAEQIGNVRIDAITFGINDNPLGFDASPAQPNFVTVVVRGRYHSDWVRTVARSERVATREVNGVDVFEPDAASAWLMPSDDLFVFMAGTTLESLPTDEMTQAVKAGKGTLAADEPMRKLVESLANKQVLWATAAVTEAQRELPVVGAFDTITLLGTREGKTLKLKMTARGRDAEQVKKAVDQLNKHAGEAAEFLEGIHYQVILLSAELLKSVKAEADGTNATLTAKLETTPAAILSLPGLFDAGPEPEPEEKPAGPRPRRP
jgi:hypothetical protein